MGCVTDSERRGDGIWMELDPVSTHRPMKVEELIESQKRRIAKKLNMLGVWEEKKKYRRERKKRPENESWNMWDHFFSVLNHLEFILCHFTIEKIETMP